MCLSVNPSETFHTSGILGLTPLSSRINEIQTLLPWIVLQSALIGAHTHSFSLAWKGLMSLHLSYQTPVWGLSANQRRERNSLLTWNKSGPFWRNQNTWLIRVVTAPLSDQHTGRNTQQRVEFKGTYSSWLGLETWPKRLSKFCFKTPPASPVSCLW